MTSSTNSSQYQLVPQAALTSSFETPTQRYEVLAVSYRTNRLTELDKKEQIGKISMIISILFSGAAVGLSTGAILVNHLPGIIIVPLAEGCLLLWVIIGLSAVAHKERIDREKREINSRQLHEITTILKIRQNLLSLPPVKVDTTFFIETGVLSQESVKRLNELQGARDSFEPLKDSFQDFTSDSIASNSYLLSMQNEYESRLHKWNQEWDNFREVLESDLPNPQRPLEIQEV